MLYFRVFFHGGPPPSFWIRNRQSHRKVRKFPILLRESVTHQLSSVPGKSLSSSNASTCQSSVSALLDGAKLEAAPFGKEWSEHCCLTGYLFCCPVWYIVLPLNRCSPSFEYKPVVWALPEFILPWNFWQCVNSSGRRQLCVFIRRLQGLKEDGKRRRSIVIRLPD